MSAPEVDRPLDWGKGVELNPLEAVMWRQEADPRLRNTVLLLEELDTAPEWERFRAAHDWGARMVPRFRKRVLDGPLGLGQPRWVVDRAFDVDHHVHRIALPDGAGWPELLELTARMGNAPFERSKPPWEAMLVEGLPDGKAAYILKMHHATLDGAAGVQLLGALHSPQREPLTSKPQPPAPALDDPSTAGLLARQAIRDVRATAGTLRGLPGKLLSAGARPDHLVRDAAAYAASARRVVGDPGAKPSPLLRGRSGVWRLGAIDVAFADLRAASKVAGGSLNDAFLAALMGGFRRYHEELGCPIDAMPIAIPIDVRTDDDAQGGNHFAGARLAGPVAERDPVVRMQAIGAMVRAARDEPALDALGLVAPSLARLPGPVIASLTRPMTQASDLQASNVPGLRDDRYIAGARIERAYGFAPMPGCAAMIVLTSHGDRCCVAVNADPAAVEEPDRLQRCLVEGFAEVLALVPGAEPPIDRGAR